MGSFGFVLLCSITFLSAFLLFQIELIIAKLFLPHYGGSYLVWGACIVFFQAVLLAGYAFAHRMIEAKGIAEYLKIHRILIFIPIVFFPIAFIHLKFNSTPLPLVADISWRLLTTIGPVFFVLSTVSLVTQSWLSNSNLSRREHPYVLYAVSNIGSFMALWTYPFIFESNLGNSDQLNIWRGLYLVLIGLNWLALKKVSTQDRSVGFTPQEPIAKSTLLRWLLLSAAAVMLFLSVTNLITYEIAPIPLLWIIPLSIYLLSFILCFKARPWYPKWMEYLAVPAMLYSVVLFIQVRNYYFPPIAQIAILSVLLFILSMYVQNQLIKTRPSTKGLTQFYVMISLGGFVGGFFTSWIIPLISTSLIEFLCALAVIAVMYHAKTWRLVLSIVMGGALLYSTFAQYHESLLRKRNYYGIYDIYDNGQSVRTMLHGTTLHGIEFNDDRKWMPIGYYSPTSPLGDVMIKGVFDVHSIAGIGLGAGTIAMYSRMDCPIDFYELDPDVVDIAKKYFWYLSSSPGPVQIFTGDARISLEQNPDAKYDIIIVDAFGGDAVPVHLINTDVLKVYKKHLNPGGAIVFHIPSRYFDLKPILSRIGESEGAFVGTKEAQYDGLTMQTLWGIITWDGQKFMRLQNEFQWSSLDANQYSKIKIWNDNYSTVLPILKVDQAMNSILHFSLFRRK